MATEDQEDASRAEVPDVDGDVEFRDVWFEYNAGVPVLKNISFHAKAGTTTALVGSSGGGKSTLVSLGMAFSQPKQGQIPIDGRALDALALHEFRDPRARVLKANCSFYSR